MKQLVLAALLVTLIVIIAILVSQQPWLAPVLTMLMTMLAEVVFADEENNCIYYHYTNLGGYEGIVQSNFTIVANSRGYVYLTKDKLSPEEAKYSLFMGGYDDYADKGTHVIEFKIADGVHLLRGTQPNEWLHIGSMRLERQIKEILYHGVNPY